MVWSQGLTAFVDRRQGSLFEEYFVVMVPSTAGDETLTTEEPPGLREATHHILQPRLHLIGLPGLGQKLRLGGLKAL